MEALRIAVADDEPQMLAFFEMALEQLRHQVIIKATNGQELLNSCRENRPDLIITDIRMPGIDGLEAVSEIRKDIPVPVILVSGYSEPEYVQGALRNHVLAYLIKPIKQEDLEPAIRLAMQRFKEFQALHQQASDLRQALEDRKKIEQAKGILIRQTGLSEPEAFRKLQLLSSQKNKKMIEIALMIITADEAFSS